MYCLESSDQDKVYMGCIYTKYFLFIAYCLHEYGTCRCEGLIEDLIIEVNLLI